MYLQICGTTAGYTHCSRVVIFYLHKTNANEQDIHILKFPRKHGEKFNSVHLALLIYDI